MLTYKWQGAYKLQGAENLWYCGTASTMQGESARQSGNGKALESALFEIWKTIKKRQNAKTIELWNVNKTTAARTKMEADKSRIRVAQWWSPSHQMKWRPMYGRPIMI